MTSYRVQFNLDGASFGDGLPGSPDPTMIAAQLRELADRIDNSGELAHLLRDVNGNRIGLAQQVRSNRKAEGRREHD